MTLHDQIINLEHDIVSFGDVDIPQAFGDGWKAALTAAAELAQQREAELVSLLTAYETWEGEMILDQKAWNHGLAPLPTLTYPLWDRLLELQRERNRLRFPTTNAEAGS